MSMNKHQEILANNPEMRWENPGAYEATKELARLGIENKEEPSVCPECGEPLEEAEGFVGETILYCKKHGICWEDTEQAIRNVY